MESGSDVESGDENDWRVNSPKKSKKNLRAMRQREKVTKKSGTTQGEDESDSSSVEERNEHEEVEEDAVLTDERTQFLDLAGAKEVKSKYSWYLDKLNALLLLQVVHWILACQVLCLWRSSCGFSTQSASVADASAVVGLINPAAPLHGGSLVLGTSILVIVCTVPSGLVLITYETKSCVRCFLWLSVLFTGYCVALSFYFFTREAPELQNLPSTQRFYKTSSELELDAYVNRLLYGFTFFISAALWLFIGILCKQFLSVLPADPTHGFGKEESAPLLDDMERGEVHRTKRNSSRSIDDKKTRRSKKRSKSRTETAKSERRRSRRDSFEL